MSDDLILNRILQQKVEAARVFDNAVKELQKATPRQNQPLAGCTMELMNTEKGQAFCSVDKNGVVRAVYGFDFLKGMLAQEGIEPEDFLKEKGWRLNE